MDAAAEPAKKAKSKKALDAIQKALGDAQTSYVDDTQIEQKPHFHEWSTALPGMICVSRKARNSTFRNYVAAETATPVISCCGCLKLEEESNFYFAGVCRSKSVRPLDDGVGPSVDEFCEFTPPCPHTHTHTKIERYRVLDRSHDRDRWNGNLAQQQRYLGLSRRHA